MLGFAVFPGRQTLILVPGCSRGWEQPLGTGGKLLHPPFIPPILSSRTRFQVPFPKPPPLNCLVLAAAFPVGVE